MKIDRVILTLNNNPTYTHFWNVVAPVWKNNFNIIPTLIFNGTKDEFDRNNFNVSFGDFFILDKINEVSESNPDWSVTWSLFWAATKFPEDICILSGIDQIPIGNFFFEKISNFDKNKFVVGFSDAYKDYNKDTLGYFNTQTNVLYPSSHLVGLGRKFKEIYSIEENWYDEIIKVYNSKNRYYLNNKFYRGKLWGLDECYSSEKISTYEMQNDIIYLDFFWKFFHPNRIDFGGNINSNYNINLVKNGTYSELTCKSYDNYKEKINDVINNIQKYI